MLQSNEKVQAYIEKMDSRKEMHTILREILQVEPFLEEFKWGAPCYTYEKHPVVIVNNFKDYVGVGFWKGVLLNDPKGLLVSPGENSQSMKMLKLKDLDAVLTNASALKDFGNQALKLEKSGAKVEKKPSTELEYPDELKTSFEKDVLFQEAFEKLTPGRRRAYILFFNGAKQSATKYARIEKCSLPS